MRSKTEIIKDILNILGVEYINLNQRTDLENIIDEVYEQARHDKTVALLERLEDSLDTIGNDFDDVRNVLDTIEEEFNYE